MHGTCPGVGLAQSVSPAVSTANVIGQYNVTFYLEPNLAKGTTQGICFKDGTWFSTTFSNWQGDWFLKGDRLRWHGRTGSELGTAEFGQYMWSTGFGGEFAHFFASPTSVPPLTSSRGNYYGARVSATCAAAGATGSTAPGADPSK